MTKNQKRIRLKSGRPPTFKAPSSTLSSKVTRNVIRTHHTLEKRRAKALADGDEAAAASLLQQITLQGGIEVYQRASLIGQGSTRGGDSSKKLLEWLTPVMPTLKELAKGSPIRMLEIGALSTTNECSRSGLFEMERIDLNSQAGEIKQQDFMERPLPQDQMERFDIISLSLVLNYVPDAVGKGKMLLQTTKFLKTQNYADARRDFFPSLFMVLPAPCITNSRYVDEAKLEAIMESLGYVKVKSKLSNKLVYYLWRLDSQPTQHTVSFKKVEIRSGKSRNNFAIVLN